MARTKAPGKENEAGTEKATKAEKSKRVGPPAVSKSSRAGLVFPVARIHRYLKKGRYSNRISSEASVFLAAILEYLVSELLESSGHAAIDAKRVRIKPRDIMLAVRRDDEMIKLMRGVVFSEAGVLPHIEPGVLAVKKKGKKTQTQSTA